MKRSFILSAVLIAVVGLFISPYCFAATYRYVDKNGQVGLADDLQMIPEPYRATAVLISGEAKEGEGTPGPAAAPAQAAGAGTQQAAVPAAPVGQAPAAAQAIKALDAMMEQAAQQAQEHDKAMKEAEQAAEK